MFGLQLSIYFLLSCVQLLIAIDSYPLSMATEDPKKRMKFEEGWPVIQEAVDKAIKIAEGNDVQGFTSEEYMRTYTIVYEMCKPMPEEDHCQELYDHYKKIFEEYNTCKVLPSLRGMEGEVLLQELAQRWSNYKTMTRWLFRFFHYIGRYFLITRRLPSLEETSFISFYDSVYGEMNNQVRDAVIFVIDRERDGDQIDQALVKNVLAIYLEIGQGSMKFYEKDFQEAMLENTASFYSEKASNWIRSESYRDYMLKVNNCLKHEREIVSCYLQTRSLKKLLEIVEHELLSVYAIDLQEKKHLEELALTDTT